MRIDYHAALKRIMEDKEPFEGGVPVNVMIPMSWVKRLHEDAKLKDQELQKLYRASDRQTAAIRGLIQEVGKLAKLVNNQEKQTPQECEPFEFRPWEIRPLSDPE